MLTTKRPNVSGTELEVLKALWDDGPSTVRALNEALAARGRQWAYTTVQTLLNRLCAKGVVGCDKRETPHVYRAIMSRDQLLAGRLDDLAGELCDGTTAPLVLALVQGKRFSKAEIRRLRQLLDDLDRGAERK